MFKSKYSTILTILLIIIIVVIVVVATILAIGVYKDYQEEKERKKIYASIQGNNEIVTNNVVNENENIEDNIVENVTINTVEGNNIQNNTSSGNTTTRPSTSFYKDHAMIGYIKIPKTGAEYPILLEVTPSALEVGVGVMYPSNPNLNEKGNVVIIGHNYRNGEFFANNDKLVIGDKIQITDLTGRTLSYKIYEISILPETDTEYITRERGNNIEISLSTCTDDGNARLVILARAE